MQAKTIAQHINENFYPESVGITIIDGETKTRMTLCRTCGRVWNVSKYSKEKSSNYECPHCERRRKDANRRTGTGAKTDHNKEKEVI